MNVDILVTDGGPHPADKWAVATAEKLMPINAEMPADRTIAALKLKLAVSEALVGHHTNVQKAEQDKLAADAANHLQTPLSVDEETDAALASVVAAAKGSPWEEKYNDPEVQAALRFILASHFMTAQDIERRWHVDRNPNLRA